MSGGGQPNREKGEDERDDSLSKGHPEAFEKMLEAEFQKQATV